MDFAELFDEEAAEFVAILKADPMPTTKHSYGRVMAMLSSIVDGFATVEPAAGFLDAMVAHGYDAATAAFLRQQYNLPGAKDSQAILMGLDG